MSPYGNTAAPETARPTPLDPVTTLYLPPYSPDLSPPDYFLFPELKMKLQGLHFVDFDEIQEAITDEIKKVQKEKFLAAFQKLYDRAQAYIYANGAYFLINKKVCVFLKCLRFFKKSSPKILDCTVYYSTILCFLFLIM